MPVPLLDLTRENRPLISEIQKAIQPLIEASQFILGPVVEEFENDCKQYFKLGDKQSAIGTSSGTDAQLLALMALESKSGSECITTPFTFFATAGVIHRAHLRPKFADIDPVTFNISPEKIEEAITSNTTSIMPVHLYGQSADMTRIMQIAGKHNLPVIEDTAQSMGAMHAGKFAGTIGDMGEVSFFPTKNLGAFGDAGMLLVNNPEYKEKCYRLRVHGSKNRYEHLEVGGNFRIDAMQAAILKVKLPHLSAWHEQRRANAELYRKLFAKTKAESEIILPVQAENNYHIYNQFVIRVKSGKRDALKAHLDKNEIGNMIYYPSPMHLQPCFSYLGYKKGDFPEAERACAEVLALPIHPYTTSDEIEIVVNSINAFYN